MELCLSRSLVTQLVSLYVNSMGRYPYRKSEPRSQRKPQLSYHSLGTHLEQLQKRRAGSDSSMVLPTAKYLHQHHIQICTG